MIEVQEYIFFDPAIPEEQETLVGIHNLGIQLEGVNKYFIDYSIDFKVPVNDWTYVSYDDTFHITKDRTYLWRVKP